MPKFNANKWKPTDDSSLGFRTTDPRRVVLNVLTTPERIGCPCGCATFPTGAKATFAMGHDATLRGKLIRAHLMGVEILFVYNGDEGNNSNPRSAMGIAVEYGWKRYLDEAVLRREGKNREVLQRTIGNERLVRVGRWEYTGQIAAVYRDKTGSDMNEVEYVDRAGQVRRTRVLAEEETAA